VCGNHDYYRSSIEWLRPQVARLRGKHDNLTWLTGGGVVALMQIPGLVGHDGWGDGSFGDGLKKRRHESFPNSGSSSIVTYW
jgi:hypothetical protein